MPPAPTLDAESLLVEAETALLELRVADFRRLRIARDWAHANPPPPDQLARSPLCAHQIGSMGLLVTQYVEAELAACLQIHPLAALRLMADGVDLDARLPATWAATAELRLEVWVARKVAGLTACLSDERARWVDAQVADLVGTMPPGRLLRIVEARVVEADQELADQIAADRAKQRGVWLGHEGEYGSRGFVALGDDAEIQRLYALVDHVAHQLRTHCPELADESMDRLRSRALGMLGNPMGFLKFYVGTEDNDVPEVVAGAISELSAEKCRPRTVLYVHFTPDMLRCGGVARAEELGALTRQRLVDLLGHEHVLLKPVIDLNAETAADCYEVPAAISEQLGLARPADCFPFAPSLSRRADKDHTIRYQWNGPPGQTRLSNLGRLVRRHHRIKTFAGWRVWHKDGTFTWVSPHGRIYLTDARGTHQVSVDVGGLAEAVDYVRAA